MQQMISISSVHSMFILVDLFIYFLASARASTAVGTLGCILWALLCIGIRISIISGWGRGDAGGEQG